MQIDQADRLLVLLGGLGELAEGLVGGSERIVGRERVLGVGGSAGKHLDGALVVAALLVEQPQAIEHIAALHTEAHGPFVLRDRSLGVAGLLMLLSQGNNLLDRELLRAQRASHAAAGERERALAGRWRGADGLLSCVGQRLVQRGDQLLGLAALGLEAQRRLGSGVGVIEAALRLVAARQIQVLGRGLAGAAGLFEQPRQPRPCLVGAGVQAQDLAQRFDRPRVQTAALL